MSNVRILVLAQVLTGAGLTAVVLFGSGSCSCCPVATNIASFLQR